MAPLRSVKVLFKFDLDSELQSKVEESIRTFIMPLFDRDVSVEQVQLELQRVRKMYHLPENFLVVMLYSKQNFKGSIRAVITEDVYELFDK